MSLPSSDRHAMSSIWAVLDDLRVPFDGLAGRGGYHPVRPLVAGGHHALHVRHETAADWRVAPELIDGLARPIDGHTLVTCNMGELLGDLGAAEHYDAGGASCAALIPLLLRKPYVRTREQSVPPSAIRLSAFGIQQRPSSFGASIDTGPACGLGTNELKILSPTVMGAGADRRQINR